MDGLDPSQLGRIKVPVLLLWGSQSALTAWMTDGVRYVADHVPDACIVEIAGAGHFGIGLHPEPIASELERFFQAALAPI